MSTSLLYHGLRIRGYRYSKTEFYEDGIVFHVTQERSNCRCSACGSAEVSPRGQVKRRFRALPLGSKAVTVKLAIRRVECHDCGRIRPVSVDFAEPRRSYTKSFTRYVVELSRWMTIQDVAHHLGVSWDLVKEIQKQRLQRHYSKPKL